MKTNREQEEIKYLLKHLEETKKTKYGAVWYSPYGPIFFYNDGRYEAIRGTILPNHLKNCC